MGEWVSILDRKPDANKLVFVLYYASNISDLTCFDEFEIENIDVKNTYFSHWVYAPDMPKKGRLKC